MRLVIEQIVIVIIVNITIPDYTVVMMVLIIEL